MKLRGQANLVAHIATLEARVNELERTLRLVSLQTEQRELQISHAKRQMRCLATLAKLPRAERAHAVCEAITDDMHWSAAAVVKSGKLAAFHSLTERERDALPELMALPQLAEYQSAFSTEVHNGAHLALTARLGGELLAFARQDAVALIALDRHRSKGGAHHTHDELLFLQAALALLA